MILIAPSEVFCTEKLYAKTRGNLCHCSNDLSQDNFVNLLINTFYNEHSLCIIRLIKLANNRLELRLGG